MDLLEDLRRERNLAWLWVTHNPDLATRFSDRLVVLFEGQIAEEGPTDEVWVRPAHPFTRALAAARGRHHPRTGSTDPAEART